MSADVKAAAASAGLYVRVFFCNNSGLCDRLNPNSIFDIASNASVTTSYQTFAGTFTVPANMTRVRVALYNYTGVSSTFYFDNVTLRRTFENLVSNNSTYLAVQGGSVGIGNASPSGLLSVGSTSQFQVSAAGAVTAVGVNSGTGLLQGTGGLTISGTSTLAAINASGAYIQSGAGANTFSGLTSFNGGLTVTTGNTFTNASSTLLTAVAITDKATGGPIGTAVATVDVATTFTVNQTTAGQTLTIPNPTVATAGRLIYIANIGTASFTMLGATISNGTTATLIWNGTAWTFAGADASSILNQNTANQTANFQISGTGQANTKLLSPLFDVATAGTLSIGTGTATAITIGKAGVTTTNAGALTVTQAGTFNGGLTVTTGNTFTNASSTLLTAVTIANLATGGNIGTAAATVDVATTFTISQTTTGQTLTIPNPTVTTAGRLIYIANVGTASFMMLGATISPGTTATLIWNGTAWTFAGADASSILNQNTTSQTANFQISGIGQANTSLLSPLHDVATAGTLSIGTGTATAITIGKAGVTTTNAGALTVTQAGTFNGGLTVTTGNTFTNASSTLLTAVAITDKATGGPIGTAVATVDVATTFTVNQTTAGQTLTIPNPTVATAGRLIYIANIGTASFTMLGATISNGTTATLIWNGTAWTFAGADASSILNQNTANQTANFRISGTGQANTSLLTPLVDTASAGTLSLGTATATVITIGKAGVTTTALGPLTVSADSSGAFLAKTVAGTSIFNIDTTSGNLTSSQGSLTVNGVATVATPTLTVSTVGGTLGANITFAYRVAAINTAGVSTEAIATSPTSVTTGNGALNNQTTVTWTLVTGAASYKVYRTTNGGVNWFVNTVSGSTSSLNDNGTAFTWATAGTPATSSLAGGAALGAGGGVTFNANNGGNTIIQASASAVTSYVLRLPSVQGSANSVLQNDGNGNLSWAPGGTCSTCLSQVPATTAQNTIAPTANNVVALTVKGTTGTTANVLEVFNSNATPTRQAFFDATGSLNVAQPIQPTANNTVDLGLSTAAFRSGYFGTSILSPVHDTQAAGALSIGTTNQTALTVGRIGASTVINGNTGSSIALGNFTVSAAGAIVGVGVNSGTGLIQGTGGLTVTGAASISGGLNNNAGGITNVGSVAGATTISANNTLTLSGTGATQLAVTGAPAASATSSLVQLGPVIAGGSASGTYLGVNPATYSGNFIDLQVGGVSKFKVDSTGVITGPASEYTQAQFTVTGGGTITWAGPTGKLKWTARIIAIPVANPTTSASGYVQMDQPIVNIPAAQVYNGVARTADAAGVVLNAWEALYAVHTVGGGVTAITYQIVTYTSAFRAPSNWLLVAAVNGDDNTIRLGTGVILKAGGTYAGGNDQSYIANGSSLQTATFNINGNGTVNNLVANTGLYTGASAGTLRLDSAGALYNITGYTQSSGNFAISGVGTFSTGTGAVTFNGATSVAGANTFNVGTGATSLGGTLGVTGAITGSSTIQGTRLISTVATGTPPLTVASSTVVTNLNADLLDGLDSTAFALGSGSGNYIQNQNASPQAGASFNIANTGTAATLNATTGINTGAGAGTQRIDASGNLVNVGNITSTAALVINTGSGDLTLDPAGNTVVKGSTNVTGTAALNVTNSSSTSLFYVRNDGNVGIGTSTATDLLTVFGNSAAVLAISIQNANAAGSSAFKLGNDTTSAASFLVQNGSTNGSYGGTNSLNLINILNAPLTLGTNNTVALTILGSGNVGIGTIAPSRPLHVSSGGSNLNALFSSNSPSDTQIGIQNASTGGRLWSFVSAGQTTTGGLAGVAAGSLSIYDGTVGTSRLVIDTGGNVGIGTNNPGSKLEVYAATASALTVNTADNANGYSSTKLRSVNGNGFDLQYNAGANSFQIATYSLGTLVNNVLGINLSSGAAVFKPNTDSVNAFSVTNNAGTASLLSVDALNSRVGIGTATPGALLEIKGAGNSGATLIHQKIVATVGRPVLTLDTVSGDTEGAVLNFSKQGVADFTLYDYSGAARLSLAQAGFADVFSITAGKFAVTPIGSQSPSENLQVSGGFRAGQAPVTATTLTDNPLNAGVFTINVVSTAGYPAAGTIVIDAEAITYTGITATSFLNASRGRLGTVDGSHASGTIVNNYLLTATGSDTTQSKFVVQGNGNVGIGVTNPSGKLSIQGDTSGNAVNIGASGITGNSFGVAIVAGTNTSDFSLQVRGIDSLDKFNVRGDGNVGIGTATPGYKLTVAGGDIKLDNNRGITFRNQANTADFNAILFDTNNDLILGGTGPNVTSVQSTVVFRTDNVATRIGGPLRLNASGAGNAFNDLVVASNGKVGIGLAAPNNNLGVIGNIAASGTITGGVAAPDYAENITASDLSIEAADVVSLDPVNKEHIVKSSKSYEANVLGVISTNPGFVTNAQLSDVDSTVARDGRQRPLALSGRVPVKVTNENGPIQAGDYLTSSSTPGHAMKATKPGPTIGKALEAFNGVSGKVIVFISTSYADPTGSFESLNITGQTQTGSLKVIGTTTTKDLVVTGIATVQDLTVINLTTTKDLTVPGTATIEKLVVKDIEVTGGLTVKGGITTAIAQKKANYTAVLSDSIITADAKDGTFTVTLPTAVGIAGRQFTIKKTDTTTNLVKVETTGVLASNGLTTVLQTIDGATTYNLSTPYKYIVVVSDGTNWIIVGNN